MLASNHVSYLDFIFCGLGAQPAKRLVRFMAKQEVFTHSVSGPLMRGMHHIPVDRAAGHRLVQGGAGSAEGRRGGRCLPGGHDQPVVHRQGDQERRDPAGRRCGRTADPGRDLGLAAAVDQGPAEDPDQAARAHPIVIGEPIYPQRREDQAEAGAQLRKRMQELLDRAQAEYPETPSGPDETWWQPAHLGGTAPTPEEAAAREAAARERRGGTAEE